MSPGLCLAALGGAVLAALPGSSFTLAWTHSVARTEWREDWRAEDGRLVLAEARITGTGAGMEPPADARREGRWWVWVPDLAPQERILLAASAFTDDHTLCAGGLCRPLAAWTGAAPGAAPPGPVEIRVCP